MLEIYSLIEKSTLKSEHFDAFFLIKIRLKRMRLQKCQKIKEFSDNCLQNKDSFDIIVTQITQRK